ncbi:hypothetical protein [Providencia alcalifaciens]|uniref:hypothetical protein n=1 Tax=Providencia alcalifaciens TaxID=126385 RepID=UPI00029BFBFF|nr:hypothetical protein OO9_08933 [Providencia alcalifaciens Dmel2]
MKTIQVTVTKLNGSVSFEVHHGSNVLIKDTLYGQSNAEFHKKYNVNCTSDKILITTTHSDSEDVEISVKVIG